MPETGMQSIPMPSTGAPLKRKREESIKVPNMSYPTSRLDCCRIHFLSPPPSLVSSSSPWMSPVREYPTSEICPLLFLSSDSLAFFPQPHLHFQVEKIPEEIDDGSPEARGEEAELYPSIKSFPYRKAFVTVDNKVRSRKMIFFDFSQTAVLSPSPLEVKSQRWCVS